nr:MAG TPA: hypothetical protein [Caudoviricetes sp.]
MDEAEVVPLQAYIVTGCPVLIPADTTERRRKTIWVLLQSS